MQSISYNSIKQRCAYIILDALAAVFAWILFFSFRKLYEGLGLSRWTELFQDPHFYEGLLFTVLFWFVLHNLDGYYHSIFKKSRFQDVIESAKISFIGSVILFFILVLDDYVSDYLDYYLYFLALFGSYFSFLTAFRLILTSISNHKIHQRKIGFPTLLIGSGERAAKIFNDLTQEKYSSGNKFVGYLSDTENATLPLPYLGKLDQIQEVLIAEKIEEVIIAIEEDNNETLSRLLSHLLVKKLVIKTLPQPKDILLGAQSSYSVYNKPLVCIPIFSMPLWQRVIKRVIDVLFCSIGLILLFPLMAFTAIKVKRSSPGPIFYTQERLGRKRKPFKIYKFRSMYVNAERDTPLLSSTTDQRSTPWGAIMRKYRLDELPQLWNVIKGDMSLVGPRPEREYFARQIEQKVPLYNLLFCVRPGITSWGEIQYGYAENVDQMAERFYYDLIYIEDLSIQKDLKILLYTILVVLRGEGK